MTEARTIAHALAGTAGMVGEPELGDIAFAAEARIAPAIDSQSSAALVTAVDAIDELITALAGDRASGSGAQTQTG